ncbi:spherulation-specific family 4 protein [Dactylosporangium sp. NPDC049140]|uniref:spherulation-specific family 4 protein n=1 Tax=Dactylosporangium sp. NPDC049140 TaxID=3155647 RepID=UPI0033D8ED7C
MDRVPTLLPLRAHPLARPYAWEIVASHGQAFTVVVDVAGGPGSGRDPLWTTAMSRLAAAGVRLLGYVDIDYGTRPVAQIRADVYRWSGYPVRGVFLDHTPVSPYAIGPVAVVAQSAARADLPEVVLNPGEPPDEAYRELGLPVCVFDGSWREYRRWSGEGARPGDGHLVHAVPPRKLDEAAHLQVSRGAGFGLVTDLGAPDPYADLPAWCGLVPSLAELGAERDRPTPAPRRPRPYRALSVVRDGAAAGSAGRSMRTGS